MIMGWIDSHVHLDAQEYASDVSEVRALAKAQGVTHCVIPSVDKNNFEAVRNLAHAFGDFYALGIHPMYTPHAKEEDLAFLEDLIAQARGAQGDARLLAVGEIGLDGFIENLDFTKQQYFYIEQLKIAKRHDLPLILHVRKSADALLKELRRFGSHGGIAHAFNGSLQQARAFIDLGFCLGFGGAVTYERANHLRALLKAVPRSAIVLETDGPDIPPHWLYVNAQERAKGQPQNRNDPSQVPRIADVVSTLLGVEINELRETTSQNVARVLRIPSSMGLNQGMPPFKESRS